MKIIAKKTKKTPKRAPKKAPKKSQKIRAGIEYEKAVAKRRGAKHKGGPGKPDYTKGTKTKGEVKKTKAKVTKPQLQKMAKKGVTEVESYSGFTKPAKEYRDKYRPNVKLSQQEKVIRKKKKK